MADITQIFSQNVKRLRMQKGFSQEYLAEKCDTSKNYISQLESAIRFASASMIDKLVSALEISSHELFLNFGSDSSLVTNEKLKIELIDSLSKDFEKIISNYKIY